MAYSHSTRRWLLACLVLSGFLCMDLQASQEEYLAAVKADVQEFKTGHFDAPADSHWLGEGEAPGAEIAGGLEGFNDFLRKQFPGTFILFQKLPDWKQKEIHQEYLATGDLGRLRTSIYSFKRDAASSSGRGLRNVPKSN